MLTEQMQQLINHLIQVEFNSAYLYLAMAAYFDRINLTGFGKWLMLQYEEELGHARTLIQYLTDLDAVAEIRGIPNQPVNFGRPLEAWQQVLTHEQQVTQHYQRAYDVALQAQDFRTAAVIQGFLKEQIDEVAQALTIVGRLQIAQDNPSALLLLDQEMGQRAG